MFIIFKDFLGKIRVTAATHSLLDQYSQTAISIFTHCSVFKVCEALTLVCNMEISPGCVRSDHQ